MRKAPQPFELSFRELADAEPQLVWTTWPNGDHDYFNRQCYEYTGAEPGALNGWGWENAIHPDDVERTRRIWTQSLKTGEPYQIEYRFRRHDGVYRWFLGRANPVRDNNGHIRKWVGTSTDIEEQKQAQTALQQREEALRIEGQRYRSLVYAASAVDWTVNPIGEMIERLPRWEEFTGQKWPEYRGFGWQQAIHPEDRPRVAALWGTAALSKLTYEVEYRLRRHDGEYRWVWVRGIPILNPDATIREWSGACIDINDLVTARETLEEERSTLRTILETLPVGVYLSDAKGHIYFMNPAGIKIWGKPPYVENASDYGIFKGWHPDTGEPYRSEDWAMLRALHGGETITGEVIDIERFDGMRRTILNNAAPIRDAQGHMFGAVVVAQDITELRQAEGAIRMSEERYCAMVAATGALTWQTTPAGKVLVDSPSWRKYTGQTFEEWLGYGWQKAIHPEDQQKAKDAWKKAVTTEQPYQIEYRLRGADGIYRWFIARGEPVRGPKGHIREWVGTSTDIDLLKRATERVEAEVAKRTQELQDALRTIRILAETSQAIIHAESEENLYEELCSILIHTGQYKLAWIGIAQHDREKTVQPVACVGYEQEYLCTLKLSWSENSPWGNGPGGRAIRSGEPQVVQNSVEDPTFTSWHGNIAESGYHSEVVLPLNSHKEAFGLIAIYATEPHAFGTEEVHLLSQVADNVAYGVMAIRRRQERIQALARLRESEERFRSAFEDAGMGMGVVSLDGHWLRVNRALCNLIGYPEEELLKLTFQDITYPEDLDKDLELYSRLKAGEIPTYQMEKRYIRKDGRIIWILLSVSVVRDPSGKPLYAISQIQDIEERKRATEELARERSFLTAVLDSSGVSIIACDPQGTLMLFNETARNLHGLPFRAIGPEQWSEHYHLYLEDGVTPMETTQNPLFKALHGERVQDEVMVIRPKNGGPRWLRCNGRALYDPQGNLLGAVLVQVDITRQLELEAAQARSIEELRRSEERLVEAQRLARIGSWEWDISSDRVFWSDEEYCLFGIESHSMQPAYSDVIAGVHPEDRDLHNRIVQQTLQDHKPFEFDYRVVHPDGTVLVLHSLGRVIVNDSGQVIRLVGSSQDVTEQRKLEIELVNRAKDLEQQRDFARRIIDNTPSGIALLNRELVFQWANVPIATFYQIPAERLIGRSILEALGPRTGEQIGNMLRRVIEKGEPQYGQAFPFIITQEGHERQTYWDFTYQPVFDRSGQVDGLLILATEVSDRVEKERLRDQQIETLRQADRVKDEFLSVISHELRTPLNAVIGFGSFLEDELAGPMNPQQHEYLNKLMKGADRMLVLIDDLLDFARIQAGKFGISPAETDYPSLVDETIASFQPSAWEKGIQIRSKVEVEQPVCLDRRRIQQVIANLLSNAIKFTPEGGWVHVRGWLENGMLVTEISDNGIGIAPEDLPKLFTPFKQLDMGLTRRAGGVGLGLSISKAIVDAHGGSIKAESEIGKGSTFTFRIPIECTFEEPII